MEWRDLVTFRDPENSRLQTQFASEYFLATRKLAGLTPECPIENSNPDQRKYKN